MRGLNCKNACQVFILWACGLSLTNAAAAETLIAELQNSQPKYILNSEKVATGLCPKIYDAINAKLVTDNLKIDYQRKRYTPFKRLQLNLKTNRTQIFCGVARTPALERDFRFSDLPLYPVSRVVVARIGEIEDNTNIMELLHQSSEEKIVTLRGSSSLKYLQSVFNLANPMKTNTIRKAMELVSRKRVDIFFYNGMGARFMHDKIKSNDLEIHTFPYARFDHYMLYNKDLNEEIIKKINNVISQLEEEGNFGKSLTFY